MLALLALGLATCSGGGGQKVTADRSADGATDDDGGAAADGDDGEGGDSEAGDDGGGGSVGGGRDGAGGTGGGDGASGGTSSGGTGTDGSSQPLPDLRPAAPGHYEYDTDGRSESGGRSHELPKVTTLDADPVDGVRQRTVRTFPANGDGQSETEQVLRFEADGAHLERLVNTTTVPGFGAFSIRFSPSPRPLVFPANVAVGDHLEFTMDSEDGNLHVDVKIDFVKRETVTVAGTRVDTIVMVIHSVLSGLATGESTDTNNVSPAHGLNVREHSVGDVTFGGQPEHTEYTAILRNLQPA